MQKALRYFQTLRYLKARQLYYQLYYRVKKRGRRVLRMEYPLQLEREGFPLLFLSFIAKEVSYDKGTFFFLNRSHSFGGDAGRIDWEFSEYGKLWSYNLNYFDLLLQPGVTEETGIALIESFLAALRLESVGLEPYPTSLRGINWIKFLSQCDLQRSDINGSLYAHYTILEHSLEYHLLGNHLLENAFSLLFGAFYFKEQRWFERSSALLARELDEQILGDGAHFELSPMYHQILLDRLLDCINLLKHNSLFSGQAELQTLFAEKAIAMLAWLKAMTFSNGSIPHLNDSTDGIAPTSTHLFVYADRLGIESARLKAVCLKESGYRKFTTSRYQCVVDVGAIGPLYIPGHAHADTLNFVLNVDGKPLLVDTAISTYEKNSRRDEERSTKAHNSVVVNGRNSSDVWGGFRVGERSVATILVDNERLVSAQHDGYRGVGVIHRREWEFHDRRMVITDRVTGQTKSVEAYLHFDHTINLSLSGQSIFTESADIVFEGAERIEIQRYMQALGFNRTVEAACAVVTFSTVLNTTILCKK